MKAILVQRRKNLFTLIELLIVVAIIAILFAMLMPALRSVKDTAERLVCLNKQKQIALSLNYYTADNNSMPLANWLDSSGNRHYWHELFIRQLEPSNKNPNILNSQHCPTDAKIKASQGIIYYKSFVVNNSLMPSYSESTATFKAPAAKIFNLQKPSQTLILADGSGDTDAHGFVTYYGFSLAVVDMTNTLCRFIRIHGLGANFIYADFHGKYNSWTTPIVPDDIVYRTKDSTGRWVYWE